MGLVFASRRTFVEPEELVGILRDDEYRMVHEDEVVAGDLIVYRDESEEVSHVGVVWEVRSNLRDATRSFVVLSQWGQSGEYVHDWTDVASQLGEPKEFWTDRP